MPAQRNTVATILERIDASDPDGCWPYLGTRSAAGYGVAKLNGKTVRVHRLAYIAAYGEPPVDRPLVCHRCNNRPCCRPDHLYADTHAGNLRYMAESGRSAAGDRNPSRRYPERYPRGAAHYLTREPQHRQGVRNPRAILTDSVVRQMRADYAAGMGVSDLGRKYGVSPQVAWQAVTRRTWKHVAGPSEPPPPTPRHRVQLLLPEIEAWACTLLRLGASHGEVAAAIGTAEATVRRIARGV